MINKLRYLLCEAAWDYVTTVISVNAGLPNQVRAPNRFLLPSLALCVVTSQGTLLIIEIKGMGHQLNVNPIIV